MLGGFRRVLKSVGTTGNSALAGGSGCLAEAIVLDAP
jgi:hypothetical protein